MFSSVRIINLFFHNKTEHFCLILVVFSASEFKTLKKYSKNRFSRSLGEVYDRHGNRSLVGGANTGQPMRDESEDESSGMGGVSNAAAPSSAIKVTHRSERVHDFLQGRPCNDHLYVC